MSAISECVRQVRLLVLDFDGCLTSNDVWTDEQGREYVRSWRGDGIGLAALPDVGVQVAVLSAEQNSVVEARCEKLRVPCWIAYADKRPLLEHIMFDERVDWQETAYLGNDTPDADCLRSVGLPIVVADAHPDVFRLARYVTKARGGYGAVREVCDLIVRVKGSKE